MWSFSPGMADDDWDLGAVVRSCRSSGAAAAAAAAVQNHPFSWFPPPTAPLEAEGAKDGPFVGSPDLFSCRDGPQELDELYRPFFPKFDQQRAPQSRGSHSPPSPATAATAVAGTNRPPPSRQPHRPLSQIRRSKRRKNQQKKVVCQVPADGLSSDVWAWRKYGQKPIKGSPYPRGYYRCSSSKGCLARKQVERSRTDPTMFIITYTGEHNHPVPTHRNSLAGSTRHKFPSPAPDASTEGDGGGDPPLGNPSSSPRSSSTAAGLSPTTPLTTSMDHELLRRRQQEVEDGDERDDDEEDEDKGMLLVEDMEVMGEDELLFMGGVEEAGGAASAAAAEATPFFGDDCGLGDHFITPPWPPNSNNEAAAAGGS